MTIGEAALKLRAGELVAFPTETVYGLGANALDAEAVAKIYQLKGRPRTTPLIVHVSSIEMAREVVAQWPPLAQQLAERWWPGPLTLVLPKRPAIPDLVTAGLPTVGVRFPDHPIALELIRAAGVPIAAPSANLFTGLSPTTAAHVREAFGNGVAVLEGGPSRVGIESTVVAIQDGKLKLLRPGMISLGELEQVRPESGAAHPSPGMHERHYSPRTPLFVTERLPSGRGAWVWFRTLASAARSVQMPSDPAGYAARLYDTLHQLDRAGLDWIAVEPPPDTPEWSAIRDRLSRANVGQVPDAPDLP
jgi:L-threonylcarbamoyladenylate synthase